LTTAFYIKAKKIKRIKRLYINVCAHCQKESKKKKALAAARTKQQFSLIIGENENFNEA
jgi:hypothetical protein